MKSFTVGIITGMTSLAVAVPLLAGVAGAQTNTTAPADTSTRVAPSQACIVAMEEMHTTCGESIRGPSMGMRLKDGAGMRRGIKGEGPMHAEMLETLGITQAELEAAFASGKTPHDIAEEKGIELPMRGLGDRGGRGRMQGNRAGLLNSEISDQ